MLRLATITLTLLTVSILASAQAGVGIERSFSKLRFERPVFLTGAGDGTDRVFVVEQAGVIRVFANDEDVDQSDVFLDISNQVSRRGNEEGLLGLAFHSNFAETGQFYVHYSSSMDDQVGVVSMFHVSRDNPNRADASSEYVLLEVDQPYRNHNGGMIAFGPDGFLYIALGDGGAADDPHGHGQDLSTLLGTILRIDIERETMDENYAIPPGNPFADVSDGAARPEIYAFGLRNPWRFSFDRETGELFAADVGQNRFEEVNSIERGGNYGWNRYEAFDDFREGTELGSDGAREPLISYPRASGISITGGYVYRGERFPALTGSYFYGDYSSGNLWRLIRDEDGACADELVRRTGRSIASFGEDDAGELFLLSFDGGIYRVVPSDAPEDTFADWPQKLSDTGLYASTRERKLAEHVIGYEVNAPFWSDGADKSRFFTLPEGAAFGYAADGSWTVPVGATLIKNFTSDGRRGEKALETRLIKRTDNGWEAATYVWDGRGREAYLAADGKQFELWGRPGVPIWHAPSASECATCHVEATGYVLGITTAQLNGTFDGENQLLAFAKRGFVNLPANFEAETAPRFCNPHDATQSLDERARVWLDVNCAMCHQPKGPGNATIDLRASTALAAARLIDEPPAQGSLGIDDARIIAPGSPARSVLLERIRTLGAGRMPNIGTNQIDEQAVALLSEWIVSLDQ